MATNSDDWGIQVSIKHGPNQQYMTNVRGYTATEIAEHLAHLGEHSHAIQEGITAFLSGETVRDQFPGAEPVRESRYGSNDNRQQSSGGKSCAVHNLPRSYKTGQKNGKGWAGYFCTADKSANPCAVEWVE